MPPSSAAEPTRTIDICSEDFAPDISIFSSIPPTIPRRMFKMKIEKIPFMEKPRKFTLFVPNRRAQIMPRIITGKIFASGRRLSREECPRLILSGIPLYLSPIDTFGDLNTVKEQKVATTTAVFVNNHPSYLKNKYDAPNRVISTKIISGLKMLKRIIFVPD